MKVSAFDLTISIGNIICAWTTLNMFYTQNFLYFLIIILENKFFHCPYPIYVEKHFCILSLAAENVQSLSKLKMFYNVCTKHTESCPQKCHQYLWYWQCQKVSYNKYLVAITFSFRVRFLLE